MEEKMLKRIFNVAISFLVGAGVGVIGALIGFAILKLTGVI